MDKLLQGIVGITETKIFMLDTFIKLAKESGGSVSLEDLKLIKKDLMKMSRDGEIGEALGCVNEMEKGK